jgi:hypothetical protein
MKEKEEKKKKRNGEKNKEGKTQNKDKKVNPAEVNKGTKAQLPPKKKQTGMCLIKELCG